MANYSEITAYAPLASFTQNRDTTAEMPQLVEQAQKWITDRLDHDFFQMTLTPDTMVGTNGVVDVSGFPDTLLEVRSVSVALRQGKFVPLQKRDLEMLMALYSDTGPGRPRNYAEHGDGALTIFPSPPAAMAVRVRANVAPAVLSVANPTNKISDEQPTLFKFALAKEVAEFNLDPQAAAAYEKKAEAELLATNMQISRWRRDEATQRPVETRNVTGS